VEIAPHLQYVAGPLPESLRAQLSEGEADPSGIAGAGLTFAPKEHFVIAFAGEQALASAGWLARDVRVDGDSVAAAALGGVLVRASCRGRGLSRVVSSEAMSGAARAGRTHGILLCKPQVEPLWAHLGWTEIRSQVTFTDLDGEPRRWPLAAMVRPLRDQPWPSGDVDLAGLPF
jgi:hypothetical protein